MDLLPGSLPSPPPPPPAPRVRDVKWKRRGEKLRISVSWARAVSRLSVSSLCPAVGRAEEGRREDRIVRFDGRPRVPRFGRRQTVPLSAIWRSGDLQIQIQEENRGKGKTKTQETRGERRAFSRSAASGFAFRRRDAPLRTGGAHRVDRRWLPFRILKVLRACGSIGGEGRGRGVCVYVPRSGR